MSRSRIIADAISHFPIADRAGIIREIREELGTLELLYCKVHQGPDCPVVCVTAYDPDYPYSKKIGDYDRHNHYSKTWARHVR